MSSYYPESKPAPDIHAVHKRLGEVMLVNEIAFLGCDYPSGYWLVEYSVSTDDYYRYEIVSQDDFTEYFRR